MILQGHEYLCKINKVQVSSLKSYLCADVHLKEKAAKTSLNGDDTLSQYLTGIEDPKQTEMLCQLNQSKGLSFHFE